MMRKQFFRLLLVVLLLSAAVPVCGQTLDAFKARLRTPLLSTRGQTVGNEARVSVSEDAQAAEAVASALRAQHVKNHFNGYRVCVFFGNGQNARQQAAAAAELCKKSFPDIPVYMMYDNPYFKVTAGNCLTGEEAIILMGRIIGVFPKAFTKTEVLSIHDLLR